MDRAAAGGSRPAAPRLPDSLLACTVLPWNGPEGPLPGARCFSALSRLNLCPWNEESVGPRGCSQLGPGHSQTSSGYWNPRILAWGCPGPEWTPSWACAPKADRNTHLHVLILVGVMERGCGVHARCPVCGEPDGEERVGCQLGAGSLGTATSKCKTPRSLRILD